MGNKKLITLKLKRGVSKKLLRIMMLILKKVPAINSEVYSFPFVKQSSNAPGRSVLFGFQHVYVLALQRKKSYLRS